MNAITPEISLAAQALRAGELVAFPTETVYGLGANAGNDRAVARIYAAKGRPSFNPLIIHAGDQLAAEQLGIFSVEARRLAAAFWPGPLTLVVPRAADCPVSLLASAGLPSIALRVPAHPMALALLKAAGLPLAAPSANRSGGLSPTSADHVRAAFGSGVSVILDGGPCAVGLESTIVALTGGPPRLLRAGGVPGEAIEALLGQPLAAAVAGSAPQAPGQLASHYAPRARLRLNATAPEPGERFIGFGPSDPAHGNLSATGDLIEAAANLFSLLHALDASGANAIAVAPVPGHGLGAAINDRLTRAAAPRP